MLHPTLKTGAATTRCAINEKLDAEYLTFTPTAEVMFHTTIIATVKLDL